MWTQITFLPTRLRCQFHGLDPHTSTHSHNNSSHNSWGFSSFTAQTLMVCVTVSFSLTCWVTMTQVCVCVCLSVCVCVSMCLCFYVSACLSVSRMRTGSRRSACRRRQSTTRITIRSSSRTLKRCLDPHSSTHSWPVEPCGRLPTWRTSVASEPVWLALARLTSSNIACNCQ